MEAVLTSVMADPSTADALTHASRDFASWDLTPRQLAHLELLMTGAFAPLAGFLTRRECDEVGSTLRLPDGRLWPLPITLEISGGLATQLRTGDSLALRDPEGTMLAVLQVEDLWPGAAGGSRSESWSAGGRVHGVRLPVHSDHDAWRLTPADLRREFIRLGWHRTLAYQTRGIMHHAHREATLWAAKEHGAQLLIQAFIEPAAAADTNQYRQVRSLKAILP